MSNTTSTLMTEGTIWKRIITFAFPLFWGNLFQQLYNTADSLIVGNFLGDAALAAVSSSGSLIFLMVGFFNGISIGAGVVIARYFGARDICSLQKAIHTTIAFGLICGCLLTLVGVFAAPQILVWMGTPSAVLPNSITYFRIYFCGSLAFVMYNIFVGILQSVGDSRHPLIYLVISFSLACCIMAWEARRLQRLSHSLSVCPCVCASYSEARRNSGFPSGKFILKKICCNGFLPMGCPPDSRIPLFLLRTCLFRQISTSSAKWLWPDAAHTRRCRVLGSCRLPASPWRLPPSSARTLGPENMTAPRRAQLSASSVQLLVRR